MPTTVEIPNNEMVAASNNPVTYEDGTTGFVDLTLREDGTAVAGVTIGREQALIADPNTEPGPPPVRVDDLEVTVNPGDSIRDITVRAADQARASIEPQA